MFVKIFECRCTKCNGSSLSVEDILELQLSLEGASLTLSDAFEAFFKVICSRLCDMTCAVSSANTLVCLQSEKLDGDNQYQCPICQKKQDAVRETRLTLLPPVLNLSILRFGYDK